MVAPCSLVSLNWFGFKYIEMGASALAVVLTYTCLLESDQSAL